MDQDSRPGSGLTCVQDLNDRWGLLNVQGDTVKPAVVHQEHVDVEAIAQGSLSLDLQSTGLVRVILGPEPASKVVIPRRKSREGVAGGGWGGWEAAVRIPTQVFFISGFRREIQILKTTLIF